ncbi:MAG: ketopantoate reductase C-terminal domain-containing protein, partial [Atribacterota bacterium]|nr:ketopantoate reductase C-terminal domain-containing protein [Atribacterota bacterium]
HICEKTRDNLNSMLQDVRKKRKTEIDFINGAIVREGEKLNIPTPVNRVMTDLIKALEESYEKQI